MKVTTYLLPVITAFGGLVSGALLEWLRDARAYKRERKVRDFARRDAQIERRNEFQRQTLVALQKEAADLQLCFREMHFRRKVVSDESGDWPDLFHPEALTDRFFATLIQVEMLGVRVRDPFVKTLLQKFKVQSAAAESSRSRVEAETIFGSSSDTFDSLNARIGELLKELDGVELAN